MIRTSVLFTLLISLALAGPADDLNKLCQDYIDYRAEYYPVWATSIGIHDYDSLLTDYSADGVFQYRNDLAILEQRLDEIDPDKLKGDDLINYKLLQANIKTDKFYLLDHPAYTLSAAMYIDEPIHGIYYLLIDSSRPMTEKAPAIFSRMKKFKDFTDQRWPYQEGFAPIFYDTAVETVDGAIELIEETAKVLMEAMPDSVHRIDRVKQNVIRDLRSYKSYCNVEKKTVRGTHVIGKDNLDFLLKDYYFLDIDSDSLKKIGQTWYDISNTAMDSLNKVIAAKKDIAKPEIKVDPNLTKQDVLDYYSDEIQYVKDFLKEHDLVTIPDDIGQCIPVETPEFMRPIHRGIAYLQPPAFSSDQTGRFYVRPIEDMTAQAKQKYSAMIQTHGFRGSVVHEAYPGHHLQLSISNHHKQPLRRIEENTMFTEGWALYCEQMMTEQGLFDDEEIEQRWLGVWGGIRYRAVRIIVDCSLADGSMTPDSALVYMNNMLGENTDYFTAEIRRYCAYPTTALSYLTGKLIILDMLEKARKKEGKSFSLKEFHDKLLAEGTIPPTLIAKKLGY